MSHRRPSEAVVVLVIVVDVNDLGEIVVDGMFGLRGYLLEPR